ncbi:DNA-binding transcriptional LysR family regulator [Nocardia transvalensis]|uniref:DNA-binding transcriptional LysR family regulator n=1 Tax=Nocardia transvalensis TaxID=37333 RepID=A0A7W9PGE9_9NOCA|nr:LysR family transcriptional regulator [Nocardia transvalensis]MBB5915652.1 DNA-binding transcriptional LysR family regulator [Nocardia transvalensis]
MPDLDLAAVRAFVTAVDEGQFSHAAAMLGISQQAVSKRVAKLEAQLGAALFDRVPAGIAATAAGRRLLPHARSLLTMADVAVAAVRDDPRPLRVAVQGERQGAFEQMRFYADRNPESDTEIVISTTSVTSRDMLVGGRADAAFARPQGGPRPLPPEIAAVPAYLDVAHLLVGRNHPLARRSSVTLRELGDMTVWIPGAAIPSEWADFYRALSEFCGVTIDTTSRADLGGSSRTGAHSDGITAMLDIIGGSATVATISGDNFRDPWHPHIRRLPIVDPAPAYPHALLWSTANSHPGLPALVSYFRDNYNRDIAVGCWIPEPDRDLFLP